MRRFDRRHERLLKGDVFSKEQIDACCERQCQQHWRRETSASGVEFGMGHNS